MSELAEKLLFHEDAEGIKASVEILVSGEVDKEQNDLTKHFLQDQV